MRNFVVTVNGKQYEVSVEEVGGEQPAKHQAVTYSAPAAPAAPAASAPANGTKVLAPFSGLIKSLAVENGAKVKKDQPILVLEAMKMDNDITAPCDGTVTYQVTKGAEVATDAVLAVIS